MATTIASVAALSLVLYILIRILIDHDKAVKEERQFVTRTCRMMCIGGSERGTCSCARHNECTFSDVDRKKLLKRYAKDIKELRKEEKY